MPYDPNHPQPGDNLDANFIRAQNNALKAQIDAQGAQIASLQAQLNSLAQQQSADIQGTARNPNGQFVNFDPNWQPSGNTNDDLIYLRDRFTDFYNIEAR